MELPAELRSEFCSVYRVFISDNIASTAFAGAIRSERGEIKGTYIGLRKSTFLKQPTSQEIITWKEQLAFGGSERFLSNNPALVQIDYRITTSVLKTDGLFYVLVHELGHLIDAKLRINTATDWPSLSWTPWDEPLDETTFAYRDDFCFYGCAKPIPVHRAPEVYNSLTKSGFITTYSAMSPTEDFAEFFAWYVMIRFKSPIYRIQIPGQPDIDMNPTFTQNALYAAKLKFIDTLWQEKLQLH
jgi:hypothetical protein